MTRGSIFWHTVVCNDTSVRLVLRGVRTWHERSPECAVQQELYGASNINLSLSTTKGKIVGKARVNDDNELGKMHHAHAGAYVRLYMRCQTILTVYPLGQPTFFSPDLDKRSPVLEVAINTKHLLSSAAGRYSERIHDALRYVIWLVWPVRAISVCYP